MARTLHQALPRCLATWILPLFVAPALAETKFASFGLRASAGIPEHGAVDVPIDTVPAVLVDSYCLGLTAELTATLTTDSGTRVHEESWTATSEAPLHHLDGLAPLAAETGHVLRVQNEDGSIHYDARFTTGVRLATALERAPSLHLVGDAVRARGATSTQAEMRPVTDPDGLGFAGVAFAETPEAARTAWRVRTGEPTEAHADRSDETSPDEVCLVPVQWDAAGRRVAGEAVCEMVTASLCSTTSSSSATAVAAALALLALGRRGRNG